MISKTAKISQLDLIANKAIEISVNDFTKLKIILPSGIACNELQNLLLKKLGTCILPKVIPISQLLAESEEVFKIPSEQVGVIDRLQEKIEITQIIFESKILGFDLLHSLRLAPSLGRLFFQIEANSIDFELLKELPLLEQPEHWSKIHQFLSVSYEKWQAKLKQQNKISQAQHQKLMFNAEIQRLKKDQTQKLLIANIFESNRLLSNFIAQLREIKTCTIIDNVSSNSINLMDEVVLAEFENNYHEAEYIAIRCKDEIESGKARIALVANDSGSRNCYRNYLDKYLLSYQDYFGDDISASHHISFILKLSENICLPFNLKNFIALFSHPLLNKNVDIEIKNIIKKNNKFADNISIIKDIFVKYNNKNTKLYFDNIVSSLTVNFDSIDFIAIYKKIIQIAQNLVPDFDKFSNYSEILSELTSVGNKLKINTIEEFVDIFKQLLAGGKYIRNNSNSNIIICSLEEACLVDTDLVIIANLNDTVYPQKDKSNPWMSKQMQKELGIDIRQKQIEYELNCFNLLVSNNSKLYLSRSRRSNNKINLPSPYLLNLKYLIGEKLTLVYPKPAFNQTITASSELVAKSKIFPSKLYATDIELLLRAPYNFYAKKILKLKKIQEISDTASLADFGNIIHKVFDKFVKMRNSSKQFDSNLLIKEIIMQEVESTHLPEQIKHLWVVKLEKIAIEFVEFDHLRRQDAKVFSEVDGSIELTVGTNIITIAAIADRIEVDSQGKMTILDYKTGVAPSQKEVLLGLSPQLVIEAIIAYDKGFDLPDTYDLDEIVIAFVKVGSSSPYLQVKEIKLSAKDIAKHKDAMHKLIKHYVENKTYATEPSTAKYDDYWLLAKRDIEVGSSA